EADDPEILDRIAWRLGWDYIAAEGPKHTAALLTRGRILESINHARLLGDRGPRSFLEATVEVDGQSLPFAVVHTTGGATGEKEVGALVDVFAARRSARTAARLICDFVANAPLQSIDPDRLKPSCGEACDEQGDLPRRVVQRIFDAGYIDTLATFDSDLAAST